MKRNLTLALLAVFVVAMSACGADDAQVDSGPSDTAAAQPPPDTPEITTTTRFDVDLVPATTKPPVTTAPQASGADSNAPVFEPGGDAVAFAIADLAYRLGIAEGDVTFVEQEERMWRDGSLGCPQPGFSYTQALVDGSRIVLQVGEVTYDYHQGRGLAPFWCENPSG